MPNSTPTIIWTPIFQWCVIRCGSKNGHPIDTCSKEIGLCAPNMLTILDSIVKMLQGELYDLLMSTGIFSWIMNKFIHISLKIMRQMGCGFGFANHIALIMCSHPMRKGCRESSVHVT